jgi:hypothetical protein
MYGLIARETPLLPAWKEHGQAGRTAVSTPGGTIRPGWFHAKIQNRLLHWSQTPMLLI